MSKTVTEALDDLYGVAARAGSFDFGVPTGPIGPATREAAVLVLFGSLDRVPAHSKIDTVPAELDVLLLRRSPNLRHHPGQVAFPGGGREASDPDARATALREANEETGLPSEGVTVVGNLTDALLPNSRNLVTPVLAWWRGAYPLVADGTEIVDVFRVPVAELLDPRARYTAVVQVGREEHRGPMFLLGKQFGHAVVWGFTAMILDRLFTELKWSVPWDTARTLPIFGVRPGVEEVRD